MSAGAVTFAHFLHEFSFFLRLAVLGTKSPIEGGSTGGDSSRIGEEARLWVGDGDGDGVRGSPATDEEGTW